MQSSDVCRYLAVFAALMTLISYAIGLFTQQAVRSVGCEKPIPNSALNMAAATPVANWFNGTIWSNYVDPTTLVSANALLDPSSTQSNLPFTCTTGNCEFPMVSGIAYSSIGYCSKCFDSTSLISRGSNASAIPGIASNPMQLPNGLSIMTPQDAFSLNASAGGELTENIDWVLLTYGNYSMNAASDANITVLSLTRNSYVQSPSGNGTTYSYP
jgi:hypothetical protein